MWHPIRLLSQAWRAPRFEGIRFYLGFFRLPLLLAVATPVLAGTFYLVGRPGVAWATYHVEAAEAWTQIRLGHPNAALQTIRWALLLTRNDVLLWRLAGQAADAAQSPDAAYCWEQARQLDPEDAALAENVARAGLAQERLDIAAFALNQIAPSDRSRPGYLLLAAQLATRQGDKRRADTLFAELAQTQPTDLTARLALAQWRLETGPPEQKEKTQADLETLAQAADSGLGARRVLTRDALRRDDASRALAWSELLVRLPEATFNDRLQRLDALRLAHQNPALAELIRQLARASSPDDQLALLRWQIAQGETEAVLVRLRDLPDERQDEPWVHIGRAECLRALRLWNQLNALQSNDLWPGQEYLRLAYLAEALQALGQAGEAEVAWQRACAEVRSSEDLSDLTERLAQISPAAPPDFEWLLLNRTVAVAPGQVWAWPRLLALELARGHTRTAQLIAADWRTVDPNSPAANGAAAWLGLLLGRQEFAIRADALDWRDPGQLAARLVVLTEATRWNEALDLAGSQGSADWTEHRLAIARALLLAVTAPASEAQSALQVARRTPNLLPEETAQLVQAADLLDYRNQIGLVLFGDRTFDLAPVRDAILTETLSRPTALHLVLAAVAATREKRTGDALAVLTRIDVTGVNPTELICFIGALELLAGKGGEKPLSLATDSASPVDEIGQLHRALELAWLPEIGGEQQPALLSHIYLALATRDANVAFWRADAARETTLLRGLVVQPDQAELAGRLLDALNAIVPPSSDRLALGALALVQESRPAAALARLQILAPRQLKFPELALAYGLALAGCGDGPGAEAQLAHIAPRTLPPEERPLLAGAGKLSQ